MSNVQISCYLVVGQTFKKYAGGDRPSFRMTVNKPASMKRYARFNVPLCLVSIPTDGTKDIDHE